MATRIKHPDKCSNCGSTKSKTFWDYDDDTVLCDKCEKHIGERWQKGIEHDKTFSWIKKIGIYFILAILAIGLLFGVYYYLLNGFGLNGYNVHGYDREGYNASGFNGAGFDRRGYDAQGYNNLGFNSNGYDKEGYNTNGYDYSGYNRQGYDINGYNQRGYDKNGYNQFGYDSQGYNRLGFNSQGYNRAGYDAEGYNLNGVDVNGHHKNPTTIEKIEEIAQDYHKTHSYTLINLFVCTDMSTDIWDLLYAQGISAKICAGSIEDNLYEKSTYYDQLADMPHAWVLAETDPSRYIAVEATGGYLVWSYENYLYYNGGMCFDNPKDFKNFLTLRDQYFTTCYQANTLVNYWNQNIAGTIATSDTYQYQGVMITKQQECNVIITELKGLTG